MTAAPQRDLSLCLAKAARSKPITENERAWIEFIRLTSCDTDPVPTLEIVQRLRSISL